jgi:hypothetical protein
VTSEEVLEWAGEVGFIGTVHRIERQWDSSPAEELKAIDLRIWPALRELDEASAEIATRPAIEALQSLPPQMVIRRAMVEMIVFHRD